MVGRSDRLCLTPVGKTSDQDSTVVNCGSDMVGRSDRLCLTPVGKTNDQDSTVAGSFEALEPFRWSWLSSWHKFSPAGFESRYLWELDIPIPTALSVPAGLLVDQNSKVDESPEPSWLAWFLSAPLENWDESFSTEFGIPSEAHADLSRHKIAFDFIDFNICDFVIRVF
jgi:hypothetical protein